MSANNQIIIKEHKGKWLVFDNVMAESWVDSNGRINVLETEEAKSFATESEALEYAKKIDETEYGIGDHLLKDEAEVILQD